MRFLFTRRFVRALFVIVYLFSPLIPLAFYFRYNWYSFFHLYSLSVFAGVVAFVYFLNQFITGGRLKVLDRLYGYDRVLLFHRRMAMVALLLIVFHHETRDVAVDLQVRLGMLALFLFVVVAISAILFLSNPLAAVPVFARLRSFMQRRLKLQYQHFRLIHNFTAIAMLLALGHVLLAGSTQESPYRFAVMLFWYCLAMGVYIWHKFIRPRIHKRHPFRVARIIPEAKGIVSLEMSMPADANGAQAGTRGGSFLYQPGQFCFVRFLTGAMARDEHPYTISSAPHDRAFAGDVSPAEKPNTISSAPHDRSRITITVKDCGDWSGALANSAAVGDLVAVDGAYGGFSYTRLPIAEQRAPLIFIAGGVGATPCISMLSELAAQKDDRAILFIWKVRSEQELFLQHRIPVWRQAIPQLRSALFVSETNESRITVKEMCSSSLSEADIGSGHYYICGPTRMIRDCQRYLKNRGVGKRRIHQESFWF